MARPRRRGPGRQAACRQPVADPVAKRQASARTRRPAARNGADSVTLVAPEDAQHPAAGSAASSARSIEPPTGRSSIACFGRGCDGAVLQLTIGKPAPVEFTLVGARHGLPPRRPALVPRGPKFARPQYVPDETVALRALRL